MLPPPTDSTGTPRQVTPKRIMELATGFWSSMVLLTLSELGICTRLTGRRAGAEELAAELGLDARGLGFLLDAAVQLGLLVREGEAYGNGPEADAFLVEGRPAFLGGGMAYNLDIYPVWGKLPQAVRSGEAQIPAESYLGGERERTRRFVHGMHHRALATARGIADGIDLTGRARLLDLGGGSGAFSILLCRKTPGLQSTLLDLPGVVEVAAEIIEAEKMADRIQLLPGDYHQAELGSGYDAALLNGILHRETEAFCRTLLQRLHRAMVPGGLVVIADVMLDDSGHGPLFATLFALNMLLTAPGGGAHSSAAHARWLEEAGFVEPRIVPLPPPALHTLVMARRPEDR